MRSPWTWDSSLAAIVFASAVAGSSYTWFQLALHTQWVPWLAWVPFVAIDVGGLYFGHNWITGRTTRVRVWGKVTTLLMVAISVAGNGLEHALAGGFIAVTLWLSVSVGAIPAMTVFALAHQWALKRHDVVKTRKPVPEVKPKPTVAPKPAPPQAPPSEIESHRGQRQVIVEWVSSQDTLPTPKVIQTRWKVSRSTAHRVLSEVRTG